MTPVLPEIERLTREIHTLEGHAMARAQSAIEFKVEIGKRLMRAKEVLGHGKFTAWAESEFGWNRRHVSRHMLLARSETRVSHLAPQASLRAALAAISARDLSDDGQHWRETAPRGSYSLVLTWPNQEPIRVALRETVAAAIAKHGLDDTGMTFELKAEAP